MSPGAAQLRWAARVLAAMRDAGVRDVVVSPGSRSTPFVLAALATEGLVLHDVVDERSAAFFALGQARATGRPSVCLATSGTAGAHYLPAVIEANAAHIPLILFTADRPLELVGCGALQTIDQPRLFGANTRAFFELGGFEPAAGALGEAAAARMAAQAVLGAQHPLPGAVHVNARARKPLEPEPGEHVEPVHPPPRSTRAFHPRLLPPQEAITWMADACRRAERGLIVLGPGAAAAEPARAALLQLARATRFAVHAEATSGLRFAGATALAGTILLDPAEPLLRSARFRREHAPDVVLAFGKAPTSAGLERLLAEHAPRERFVVEPYGWNDPVSSASAMVLADCGTTAELLTAALAGERPPSAWGRTIVAASAIAREAVAAELARDALGEGHIARELVRAAPAGSIVMAGNGLAIRHLDLFAEVGLAAVEVLAQRGASGIDGLISGAAGAASASGRPVSLLLGDVSVLHDLGGLAAAASIHTPLVIVAIHNDGGRIFEQLPLARREPPAALAHWITPHGRSFAGAAATFGIPHVEVTTRAQLAAALARAHDTAGATFIEARVDPHDARDALARIEAAVERRLFTGKETS